MSPQTLNDTPVWKYLLRDFYELYRYLPAGGSKRIRAHQRQVRESISRTLNSNPEVRKGTGIQKPVTAHLRRALDRGLHERHSAVLQSIKAVHEYLDWQYGYEKMPKGLEKKFAYAEICGPNGPVLTNEVILGLVLFAPTCTYPAHAHEGITESYICLSGAVSENDQGVYAPGSLIFNPPGQTHRITVADNDPSLLAYAWVGEPEMLATQKMVFSRSQRK